MERTEDMASTTRTWPRDEETGNGPTSAADPPDCNQSSEAVQPVPPTILEHARLGHLDLFRDELESGKHPLDFKAGRGVYFNRSPLHLAAMEGHDEIVEFILSRPEISREVVNAKDCFGYTPLHLAVRHSHESVTRLLTTSSWVLPDRFLTVTSEPDEAGLYCGGFTPCHLAAALQRVGTTKLLIRQPCQVEFAYDPVNFSAVTWRGETPLDVAQGRYYPNRLEFLLEHGRSVPFDEARRQNYLELVSMLGPSDSKWVQEYTARTFMSANAILVGAALVAAATFGSILQPPGGLPVLDSGPSSSPSAFASDDKYWNSVFYVCVSFAFALSVVSLVIATVATLPFMDITSLGNAMNLRRAVGTAQLFLLLAVLFLLFCFSFAGSLLLSNFAAIYGTNCYYAVTWLPFVAFVYTFYFLFSWVVKANRPCSMTVRLKLLLTALIWGLSFAVPRFVKK